MKENKGTTNNSQKEVKVIPKTREFAGTIRELLFDGLDYTRLKKVNPDVDGPMMNDLYLKLFDMNSFASRFPCVQKYKKNKDIVNPCFVFDRLVLHAADADKKIKISNSSETTFLIEVPMDNKRDFERAVVNKLIDLFKSIPDLTNLVAKKLQHAETVYKDLLERIDKFMDYYLPMSANEMVRYSDSKVFNGATIEYVQEEQGKEVSFATFYELMDDIDCESLYVYNHNPKMSILGLYGRVRSFYAYANKFKFVTEYEMGIGNPCLIFDQIVIYSTYCNGEVECDKENGDIIIKIPESHYGDFKKKILYLLGALFESVPDIMDLMDDGRNCPKYPVIIKNIYQFKEDFVPIVFKLDDFEYKHTIVTVCPEEEQSEKVEDIEEDRPATRIVSKSIDGLLSGMDHCLAQNNIGINKDTVMGFYTTLKKLQNSWSLKGAHSMLDDPFMIFERLILRVAAKKYIELKTGDGSICLVVNMADYGKFCRHVAHEIRVLYAAVPEVRDITDY